MPVVNRADKYNVDIISVQQPSVVCIGVRITDTECFLSSVYSFLPHIRHSRTYDVLLLGLIYHPRTKVSIKRSEEHTSELQSRGHLVCRLLLEKKHRTDATEALG